MPSPGTHARVMWLIKELFMSWTWLALVIKIKQRGADGSQGAETGFVRVFLDPEQLCLRFRTQQTPVMDLNIKNVQRSKNIKAGKLLKMSKFTRTHQFFLDQTLICWCPTSRLLPLPQSEEEIHTNGHFNLANFRVSHTFTERDVKQLMTTVVFLWVLELHQI